MCRDIGGFRPLTGIMILNTLRDISEKFLPLNTGGRRYILEFEEGIVELNPELQQDRGKIYPGQKIRINYWVKE